MFDFGYHGVRERGPGTAPMPYSTTAHKKERARLHSRGNMQVKVGLGMEEPSSSRRSAAAVATARKAYRPRAGWQPTLSTQTRATTPSSKVKVPVVDLSSLNSRNAQALRAASNGGNSGASSPHGVDVLCEPADRRSAVVRDSSPSRGKGHRTGGSYQKDGYRMSNYVLDLDMKDDVSDTYSNDSSDDVVSLMTQEHHTALERRRSLRVPPAREGNVESKGQPASTTAVNGQLSPSHGYGLGVGAAQGSSSFASTSNSKVSAPATIETKANSSSSNLLSSGAGAGGAERSVGSGSTDNNSHETGTSKALPSRRWGHLDSSPSTSPFVPAQSPVTRGKVKSTWQSLKLSVRPSAEGGDEEGGSGAAVGNRAIEHREAGDKLADSGKVEHGLDLQQLDVERSNMDRTARLGRVASARLLCVDGNSLSTRQQPASPLGTSLHGSTDHSCSPVTHSDTTPPPRIYSGSRVQSPNLQLHGTRAELLKRGSPLSLGASADGVTHKKDRKGRFAAAAGTLQHSTSTSALMWSNDDGTDLTYRPPSRQREAFPTHLATESFYPFSKPILRNGSARTLLMDNTHGNKTADGCQQRPRARHKPPEQSLFLEEPIGGGPRVVTAASLVEDNDKNRAVAAAAVTSLATVPAECYLDLRHDDPARDGFNVLEVEGPCPFRIEVTNSTADEYIGEVAEPVNALSAAAKPLRRKSAKGKQKPLINFSSNLAANFARPLVGTAPSPDPTSSAGLGSTHPTLPRATTAITHGQNSSSFILDHSGHTPEDTLAGGSFIGLTSGRTDPADTNFNIAEPVSPWQPLNTNLLPTNNNSSGNNINSNSGRVSIPNSSTTLLRQSSDTGMSSGVGAGNPGTSGTGPSTEQSEWSMHSWDDHDAADDGMWAASVSTLDDTAMEELTLNETTLGLEFLNLFAPSPMGGGFEND